jgi:hypothetical protein
MKTNVMALKRLHVYLFLWETKFPHTFLITGNSIKETLVRGNFKAERRQNSDVHFFNYWKFSNTLLTKTRCIFHLKIYGNLAYIRLEVFTDAKYHTAVFWSATIFHDEGRGTQYVPPKSLYPPARQPALPQTSTQTLFHFNSHWADRP